MINLYELQRFLNKQQDDLLDFLKPTGLALDSASFYPKPFLRFWLQTIFGGGILLPKSPSGGVLCVG